MGRRAQQIAAVDAPTRDPLHATLDLLALLHDRPRQARRLPATARLPLENAATRTWRGEQQRFTRVCGCAAGSVVALLALAGALAWSLTHTGGLSPITLAARTAGLGLAATLIGATTGKLSGIAWGTARFRRATVRAIAALGRTAPSAS